MVALPEREKDADRVKRAFSSYIKIKQDRHVDFQAADEVARSLCAQVTNLPKCMNCYGCLVVRKRHSAEGSKDDWRNGVNDQSGMKAEKALARLWILRKDLCLRKMAQMSVAMGKRAALLCLLDEKAVGRRVKVLIILAVCAVTGPQN